MDRVPNLAVATFLLGIHLAHNALLSRQGMPAGLSPAWQERHFYYLGVVFAQPAILAAWTWYGTGSLADRVRWSTLFAFMLGNAMLFGTYVNQGRRLSISDLSTAGCPVIQYATVLGLLAVAARFGRLRTPRMSSTTQIRLKEIFLWVAVLAMGLAGMSAFLHSSTVSGAFDLSICLELLRAALFMAFMSGPIIATVLVVLGNTQRNVLPWAVVLLVAQQLVLLIIGVLSPPLVDFLVCEWVILVTMHATAALTALPFRGCDVVATREP